MNSQENSQTFLYNLYLVLAHTAVYECQRGEVILGLPPGFFRNDTTYQPPSLGDTAAQTIQAEEEAMAGSGPFAGSGSLPSLIAQYQPQYEANALAGEQEYLGGVNGQPGMLSIEQNQIQPAEAAMANAQAGSNIQTVNQYAPQVMQTMRSYNPQVTGTLDTLNQQASQQLALNGALDPFTKTMLANSMNQQQANRGLGTGVADAAATSYYENAQRVQNRAAAQQLASGVAGQTAGYYSDPFSRVMGLTGTGTTTGTYGAGAGYAGTAGAPVAGGFSMSNPLIGMQYQAQNQANQYGAQSMNDLWGGVIAAVGNVGGSAMKFA